MSDWRRRELQRSDDPVDQQRYRVELCRAGEHCGCQDEAGPAPTFEVYQERRFRRERDGFDVLQITLEISGQLPRLNDAPTPDAEIVQSEVSLAGEWLRTRPWLVRSKTAEREREQFFRDGQIRRELEAAGNYLGPSWELVEADGLELREARP